MTEGAGAHRWADALAAATLLATDPHGLKGAVLRGDPTVAEIWLTHLAAALPPGTAVRRLPIHIDEDRLIGGLDLAATLACGRPVAGHGLLAASNGGVLLVPMAERLPPMTAARLAQALDQANIADAFGTVQPARILLILLDEGEGDETPPPALLERLAFHIDLRGIRPGPTPVTAGPMDSETAEDPIAILCHTAALFGIDTLRAPLLAHAAALASAAAAGAPAIRLCDLALAAALVLAPRATRLPADPAETDDPAPPPPEQRDAAADPGTDSNGGPSGDLLVEATRAALPPDLMAALLGGKVVRGRGSGGRGVGQMRRSPTSGRRTGARAGIPRNGARLDLVETLKAAAPFQVLRRADLPAAPATPGRVLVRRGDFRVRRLVRRAESTTIFVVDASGSAAMARLGETKGAVELLLAEAYVRRDEVALIAFRGAQADVLLPPTRSLARARRCLSDLAGGGGTPLAAAIAQAEQLAVSIRDRGRTPFVLFLTDGRANIARDGATGPAALADAMKAADRFAEQGVACLFLDTAARPRSEGPALAAAMQARHVPLPRVEAESLRTVIRAARA